MYIFRFVIITFLILMFFTCHGLQKSTKSPVINFIVQSDLTVKDDIENIFKYNPEIVHPETGIKYHIQIVEPDPSIDYHILQVKPSSEYDYHMIIIDPTTNQITSKLDSKLTGKIIESIKKHNQSTKKKP